MKKLTLLSILLIVGCIYGDTIVYKSGEKNRTIKNVNIEVGTLDIYMSSEAGCSYCTDDLYDNQNNCELFGNDGSGASWNFDSNMDENP